VLIVSSEIVWAQVKLYPHAAFVCECSQMKRVDVSGLSGALVLWMLWTFFCPSISLVCCFFLVADIVLSAGRFEPQVAGALVQSSLEEVIKRFIHFSPNPSSDSISIPAAINPNASSFTAVHPKLHSAEVKCRGQIRTNDGNCSINSGWT